MLKLTLILALVAFAAAVPIRLEEEENLVASTEAPEVIAIIQSESNQNADGSYNFLYESSDGSFREENAEIVSMGSEEEKGLRITGSYKYIDANGDEIVVTYTADENGFVPVGTNINKEISDAALAAKDLPKEEPKGRSLKLVDPVEKVVEKKVVKVAPVPVVEEVVQEIPVAIVEDVPEAVAEPVIAASPDSE